MPVAFAASHEEIVDDFIKSADVISVLTGQDVYSIAYPYGMSNAEIIEAAEKTGFRLGFVLNGTVDREGDLLQLQRICLDYYSLDEFREYFHIDKSLEAADSNLFASFWVHSDYEILPEQGF